MPTAFSTCWNAQRHQNGGEMLREIISIGFHQIELGHSIRLPLLPGIREARQHGAAISSLHNFCPVPIELQKAGPDSYQFTSHRPEERNRALKLTYQTIDLAVDLGVPYVILHLGSTPMAASDTLETIAAGHGLYSRRYIRSKLAFVQKRERLGTRYYERAMDALRHLAEYAAARNIHLGIESRHGYEQIPSEREMLRLLDELNSPYVGYWHDFGHVQIKANLCLLNHADWLRQIRHRLLGCHLHDVKWPTRDHQPPFTGMIDFDTLIPLLPPGCLLVWEMSPNRSIDQILAARDAWQRRFGI